MLSEGMDHAVAFFVFVPQVCWGIYPQRVIRVTRWDIHVKDIQYHSDNNYYIIGPRLKSTFSLSKHHRSCWLDFFFLDVFSPENVHVVKQRAALD